jgi:hypothetical protein
LISGGLTLTGSANILGTLRATAKSFLIDHPTIKGSMLQYGSLEGPEHGVYVRGILKDNNLISLPTYWSNLIDENSITVNLTPIGKDQGLYVVETNKKNIIIQGNGNIHCYYHVFAERIDIPKLKVEFKYDTNI